MVASGETLIAAVDAPVLQLYDDPPEAVRVAEAPLQIVPSSFATPDVSVMETDATGKSITVMVCEATAVQLFALVTVTV